MHKARNCVVVLAMLVLSACGGSSGGGTSSGGSTPNPPTPAPTAVLGNTTMSGFQLDSTNQPLQDSPITVVANYIPNGSGDPESYAVAINLPSTSASIATLGSFGVSDVQWYTAGINASADVCLTANYSGLRYSKLDVIYKPETGSFKIAYCQLNNGTLSGLLTMTDSTGNVYNYGLTGYTTKFFSVAVESNPAANPALPIYDQPNQLATNSIVISTASKNYGFNLVSEFVDTKDTFAETLAAFQSSLGESFTYNVAQPITYGNITGSVNSEAGYFDSTGNFFSASLSGSLSELPSTSRLSTEDIDFQFSGSGASLNPYNAGGTINQNIGFCAVGTGTVGADPANAVWCQTQNVVDTATTTYSGQLSAESNPLYTVPAGQAANIKVAINFASPTSSTYYVTQTTIDNRLSIGTIQLFTGTSTYTPESNPCSTESVAWANANVVTCQWNQTGNSGRLTSVVIPVSEVTPSQSNIYAISSSQANPGPVMSGAVGRLAFNTADSVTLSSDNASLTGVGKTSQLRAVATYPNGESADITSLVTWSSSDTAVATVNTNNALSGLVTAIESGTATISASLGTLGSTNNIPLTVGTATLTGLALSPSNTSGSTPVLSVGATQQFTVTGTYSDSTTANITNSITWSSNNTTRATISNTQGSIGVATGVESGSVTFTATIGSNSVSTTANVINAFLTSLTVTEPGGGGVLGIGESEIFEAVGSYGNGNSYQLPSTQVIWTSSDDTVATVNSQGVVTGIKDGSVTITGLNYNGARSTVDLTITDIASIDITTRNFPGDECMYYDATSSKSLVLQSHALYTGGGSRLITGRTTWSSPDITPLTFSYDASDPFYPYEKITPGASTPIGAGNIKAQYQGFEATLPVTVVLSSTGC